MLYSAGPHDTPFDPRRRQSRPVPCEADGFGRGLRIASGQTQQDVFVLLWKMDYY
jgi:hypothetical protein